MFAEGEWTDKTSESHLPPVGNKWGSCSSLSPNGGRWICTREAIHTGPHRAARDLWIWTAEWDDDRSTDPSDMVTVLD